MGGPNTAEKVNWMCNMVVELFKENPSGSIQADDVLEYLSSVLDNEFDTIIDDGSAEMVCSSIVGYYNRLSVGDRDFVVNKLEALIAKQALLKQSQQQLAPAPEPTEVPASEQNNSRDTEMADDSEPVDDGWTVVRRKK